MLGALFSIWPHSPLGVWAANAGYSLRVPSAPETTQYVFSDIDVGWWHACAVDLDGVAWCWGANETESSTTQEIGLLGNGSTVINSAWPLEVLGLDDVTDIAVGALHSCAVRLDGSVWCWGSNYAGMLGNDEVALGTSVPIQVQNLPPITSIDAGPWRTCGIDRSGAVYCWGYGWSPLESEPAPDRYFSQPIPIQGITDAIDVSAGTESTCAVRRDGTAWCWGWKGLTDQSASATETEYSTVPIQIPSLLGIKSIEAGGYASDLDAQICAISSDYKLLCWGQLNQDQWVDVSAPRVILPNAQDVVFGAAYTCATTTVGTVMCWGDNEAGQLGTNNYSYSAEPVQVSSLTDVKFVSAGGGSWTCAQKQDGTAWCWGSNMLGRFGNGELITLGWSNPVFTPVQVGVGAPDASSTTPTEATSLEPDIGQAGLVSTVYAIPEGQEVLPDFSAISDPPLAILIAPNVNVPSRDYLTGFPGVADRFEWFAIRFEGVLNVAEAGDYQFQLVSDDGSRLFVNEVLNVDHDGLQASTTAIGELTALSRGSHDVVLEYFQGPGGGLSLQLFWKTPGSTEFVIVPPDVLSRPSQSARDRVQISVAEDGTLVYSDERVSTSAVAASLRDATSTLTTIGTYSGGLVTILLLALLGILLEFPFNWIEARAKSRYMGIMARLRKAAEDPRVPRILGIRVDVILFLVLAQVIVQLNAPLALIPPISQILQTATFSALALLAISAWYALPRILMQRRAYGDTGEFRAEWPSLVVALFGLAAAQLSGIVPGFLIGLFTVRKFRRVLPDGLTARGTLVATVSLVALGVVAWFALDMLEAAIPEPTDLLRKIGDGLLGVLLVAGSQGALLNLLDPGDDGAMALRRSSLIKWLSAVGLSGLLAFALLAAGKIDLALFAPPTSAEHYVALLGFAIISFGLIVGVDRLTQRTSRRRRGIA